jgi:hypothetical protein
MFPVSDVVTAEKSKISLNKKYAPSIITNTGMQSENADLKLLLLPLNNLFMFKSLSKAEYIIGIARKSKTLNADFTQ